MIRNRFDCIHRSGSMFDPHPPLNALHTGTLSEAGTRAIDVNDHSPGLALQQDTGCSFFIVMCPSHLSKCIHSSSNLPCVSIFVGWGGWVYRTGSSAQRLPPSESTLRRLLACRGWEGHILCRPACPYAGCTWKWASQSSLLPENEWRFFDATCWAHREFSVRSAIRRESRRAFTYVCVTHVFRC